MWSNLLIVFGVCAVHLFRKSVHMSMNSRLVPTLSTFRFSVTDPILIPLIPLALNFVQGIIMDSFGFFYMQTSNLNSTVYGRCCPFTVCISGTL